MKRGPVPKQPALRGVQTGGRPRARHAKRDNRQSSHGDGVGPPPDHLNDQRASWVALAAGAPAGTLAGCDRPLLESYVTLACAHAANLSSLNTAAAAESAPIVRELRRMATLMRGLAGDLGLAPSARQRQPVPGASDHGDPVSRFFGPAR